MKFFPSLILSLCCAVAANAQTNTLLYQRSEMVVVRAHPPASALLPWQPENTQPTPESASLKLNVDIRDGKQFYRQEGWFDLSRFADKYGMLFVFDTPQKTTIATMPIYTPLDILFVNDEGIISAIMPSINLSELTKPLENNMTVKAMLLLGGGECAHYNIAPGDHVSALAFFQPQPVILGVAPK